MSNAAEPYRWVQAIANRREYVADQLREGSPVVALSCEPGVLMLTVSRQARKLFEVYDRIALGGLGHPADLERIRLMAIDLAHLEGYARSPQDVSVERLVNFGICRALKEAFELIYEAPFVARCLLAELGATNSGNIFCTVEFDGSSSYSRAPFDSGGDPFAAMGGTAAADQEMAEFLREHLHGMNRPLDEAILVAAQAWMVGYDVVRRSAFEEAEYDAATLRRKWREATRRASVEVAVLERGRAGESKWRGLGLDDWREWLKDW